MRELTVYYCLKCGHYGYYQIPKNAVCPVCRDTLTPLPMSYRSFMNLEFEMRDKLIANQITNGSLPSSSVVQRITEMEKSCDSRFIASKLRARILDLESSNNEILLEKHHLDIENEVLRKKVADHEHTIDWMHNMIWDLSGKLHSKKQSQI